MQQTKSCVNRMLPETSPSGVHAGCCLHSHGQQGRILLAAYTTCPNHCGEWECGSHIARGTELFFGCWGCKDPGHSAGWRGGTEPGMGSGTPREKGQLLQVQPHSSHKAAKLKARMGQSSLGGATKQPPGSLAGAKTKIKSSQSTEEPPGVACWPLQDKDGAIAGQVHQLLLSLGASGKTHGKQRKGSHRPPQGLRAGPSSARKSGKMPAGLGTLRDSGFHKAKPGHCGRASTRGPLQGHCSTAVRSCRNTGTVLGRPATETPHDGTFGFFLATFAGR